ncbi:MAG: ATP-binding cassette domain-containing protein [Thermoanaerobaculia bacterium]
MNPAAPIIEARDLHKSFGDHTVLDGINLEIETGETLIILGASGSGKSTLLRCLIGLEEPDEGEVIVAGTNLFRAKRQELARLRESMGVAFQAGALFTSMTVGENIDLPLEELTDLPKSTRQLIVRIKLALSAWTGPPISTLRSSRAVCGNGSPSRAPWLSTPTSCSPTSPLLASTPSPRPVSISC